MTVVVFDLEFTTWDGARERGWSGPGEHREVVQVGAVRLDARTLEERAAFSVLVRPRINPVLSSFFERLTGITNSDLSREGMDIAAAFPAFKRFRRGAPLWSYGRDDLVLAENIALYGLELTAPVASNIRAVIREASPELSRLNSGHLATALGLAVDWPGAEHDALYDCRSIAAALRHLVGRGMVNPFQ